MDNDPSQLMPIVDAMVRSADSFETIDLHLLRNAVQVLLETSPAYFGMQRGFMIDNRMIRSDLSQSLPPYAVFLSFRQLLKLEEFEPRQQLGANTTGRTFLQPGRDDIWLAIFVSHRWTSLGHPDKDPEDCSQDGAQLNVLKRFVRMIVTVVKATRGYIDTSGLSTPLRRYGWLQAYYITGLEGLRSNANQTSSSDELESLLLDHCGVWYDYCCLHQKTEERRISRTDEQTLIF